MNNLRDIRRRLRATENIKKITEAMERVAAAQLRRAQNLAEQTRPYASKMKEMLERLTAIPEISHPVFIDRPVKKSALIIVSSDKGLAGSHNANVFKEAEKFLSAYQPENISLILFGRKGNDYFRNKQWPIEYSHIAWAGKITYEEVSQFSKNLVNDYLNEKYDQVWIVYTRYLSMMKRPVALSKFLSIEKPHFDQPPKALNYIFEPSPAEILVDILPRYFTTRILEILQESYAAELSARIMAMQMANRNSEKMIESLTLTRNKVRQEGITREMIEISSGMST